VATLTGDILQITEFQRQANQPLLNVYFYEVTVASGNPTAAEIAEFFAGELWGEVRQALASNALTMENVEVRNLTNGVDFGVFEVAENGAVSATEPLPPYCTVTIRLNRTTLVTRNGYKRYAGINEGIQNNGTLTSGGLTAYQGMATVLEALLAFDAGGVDYTLKPVIVGVNPMTGKRDLTRLNDIASASVNQRLGTQNTRKIKAFS